MVPQHTIREIQQLAKGSSVEICGLIAKDFQIYPISNVSRFPENCFIFNRKEYAQAVAQIGRENILCIYHSHPYSTPEPSPEDLEFIKKSRLNALIVSGDDYRWIYAS